jgi:putative transposase
MTAPSSIDPARFLHEQLESASPDLLRSMLTTFINTLMSAEADAVCGAPYGMPGPDRVNVRNGYRHRDFDTRAGTLDVAIPKLRSGSYFPDWLLERRRRAEAALTSVVATCYLLGVPGPADGKGSRWRTARPGRTGGSCSSTSRAWHAVRSAGRSCARR